MAGKRVKQDGQLLYKDLDRKMDDLAASGHRILGDAGLLGQVAAE